MKVIRFTYEFTDIQPSEYLKLFFQMVGIYVVERYVGSTFDIPLQDKQLFGDISEWQPEQFQDFDAEIYYCSSERIFEVCRSSYKLEAENAVLVLKSDLKEKKNFLSYSENNKQLLDDILQNWKIRNVISAKECKDLQEAADIYDQNQYWQLAYQAKYFFQEEDSSKIDAYKNWYDEIIEQILACLRENGASNWGNVDFKYLQFSALNLIFELDDYCRSSNVVMMYQKDSVLKVSQKLREAFMPELGDSVILLEGRIYDILLDWGNPAYERYVECCREGTYNAYVFFRKGQYWQKYNSDYKKALRYYLQSIKLFPEYYRAWYKVGLCYYELEKYEEALKAFALVKQILMPRLKAKWMNPMEMEHLYRAQCYSGYINYKKFQNFAEAFRANLVAEAVYETIQNSNFIPFMCNDTSTAQYCKEVIRNNFNIKGLYREQAKLNSLMGRTDTVRAYEEKL